jgi:2-polyprenyl-6-methoxyphenol hydroxylase-like FAD-dependent oxidoreductase
MSSNTINVVICGAGIAGLAFAIRLAQLEQERVDIASSPTPLVRVTVLERGHNDESRRGNYTHTISIRADVGGTQALTALGLYDAAAAVSNTKGMFVCDARGNLALSTEWFSGGDPKLAAIRIVRYELWQLLLAHAQAVGVEIQWGADVTNADVDADINGVIVEYNTAQLDNQRVIGDLVVVADGARSVLRERLTVDGAQRQFLNVAIVGGVFDGVSSQLPAHMRGRHGMLIGDKSMCFVAEEGHGAELVSVSATFDREVSREDVRDDAAVRSRFLATLEQYSPSVVAPLVAAIERQSDSLLIVNALDRMPHAPVRGCVAFLGDASHAVSPLGGSGANMALTDAVALAEAFHRATKNIHKDSTKDEVRSAVAAATADFYAATSPKIRELVERQRTIASLLHHDTLKSRVVRFCMMRVAPFCFAPGKLPRFAFAAGVVCGVLGAAYGIAKLLKEH